ncbi:MAG TPA: hypothetical protein VN442_22365 [Bryobacteraceae bacterium]|nr:hypothetical protein [Bryobacteraceae bacterium]
MPSGAPSTLQKVLENRLLQVAAEAVARFDADAAARVQSARRSVSEHLNQAVRRLRETRDFTAASAVLLESSAAFCNGAAVFRVTGSQMHGECVRCADEAQSLRFASLEFPASDGAAFSAALTGGDPVVAVGSAAELSPAVAELFRHPPEERVALFPVASGGNTAGVLYAWGQPEMAALELLAQAAGLALGAFRPPDVKAAALVEITPSAVSGKRASPDWMSMRESEREHHLRAQRFARVQVAEIRLYRPGDVAAGRARRDLYGALGDSIDPAREIFRRQFLIPTAGMVDYLHEELLRTLANNDPSLLGEKYPGPLA